MPTTFNVISLGNVADYGQTDIDPTETDGFSENAAALVGLTFGGVGDELFNNIQELSMIDDGGDDLYNTDNSTYTDTFSIDGGPAQTMDALVQYNATITFDDGTTGTLTAVIFQDTDGNLYLAPENTPDSPDQLLLESKPIRSLTIDSIDNAANLGMDSTRPTTTFICFARNAGIETNRGRVLVQDLRAGDMVLTLDNGYQPIKWIGSSVVWSRGDMAPVKVERGALGNDKAFYVSPQHRMMLSVRDGRGGYQEILVPAKKLVNDHSIRVMPCKKVEYFHILFETHQIIFVEGCPSESLYLGKQGWAMLSETHRAQIVMLCGTLFENNKNAPTYYPTARHVVERRRQLRDIQDRLEIRSFGAVKHLDEPNGHGDIQIAPSGEKAAPALSLC